MSHLVHYFRNSAADISYSPDGYLRTDWRSLTTAPCELRAIYERVLWAMRRRQVGRLLFVHWHAEVLPEEVQKWLITNWLPRVVQQVGYERCAIVEANPADTPAMGQQVLRSLQHVLFDNSEAASSWLLRPVTD